jgi:hypothetical protein
LTIRRRPHPRQIPVSIVAPRSSHKPCHHVDLPARSHLPVSPVQPTCANDCSKKKLRETSLGSIAVLEQVPPGAP